VNQGIEFSRSRRYFVGIIPLPDNHSLAPRFVCRFRHKEADVFTIRYDQLDEELRQSAPKLSTTIRWKWPNEFPDSFPLRLLPDTREEDIIFPILSQQVIVDEGKR
jgi:hypothetical protein